MSFKKQVLSGTFWTTASAGTTAVIQVLQLSILTRFLDKSDFGLVAIVLLVLGFTHIFVDLGVSVSLYSHQNISKKEYSSLYWVSLLLGIFLYVILLLITPVVSHFYHLPQLNKLIPIMGLDLIITTAGRQFRVFREKDLQFKSLAMIDIASLILSLGIALWLAIIGAGVYSLILSTLFSSALATILLILTGYKKHPLNLYINLKEGRNFYRIGFYQTGSQILDYISSRVDIILIGRMMSTSDLGVYNLVKQLVFKVYGLLNPIVTKVSVPLLAALQEDLNLLKIKYLQMISIIAFVNFGIYGLMALLSKNILLILYGASYQNASIILQILCIWGGLSAVGSAVTTIAIFKGRTDLGFNRTILRVLINPLFVIVGAYYGLSGIVIGQVCYSVLFFILNWKLLVNKIMQNISFFEYSGTTLRFMFFAGITFLSLSFFSIFLHREFNHIWLNISLLSITFSIIYLLLNKKTLIQFFTLTIKKE